MAELGCRRAIQLDKIANQAGEALHWNELATTYLLD